jgi:hypothetical protein
MSNFKKLAGPVQVKLLRDALDMLSDALAQSPPPGPLVKVEVNGVALAIVLAAMTGADLVEGAERASKYFESDGRSVE